MNTFLLPLLLSFQSTVSWNFADRFGNQGRLEIDASRIGYCTEGTLEKNASVSYAGFERKISVCLDKDVLTGISGDNNGIDFVMELHPVAEEFAEWSSTREFENSPTSKGCSGGSKAGAIMAFGNGIETEIQLKYFCLVQE